MVPDEEDKNCFSERMINSQPRVAEGLSLEQWLESGRGLNTGNPWAQSSSLLDRLRGRIGFWKALGTNRTVLSWIAYGLPLLFQAEPRRLRFKNHASFHDHIDFARKEFSDHLADGRFSRIRREDVSLCSPQQVEVSRTGKLRRVDDLRYLNGFLAHISVKLENLQDNIPDTVTRDDLSFTYDIKKAYYMLRMERKARSWMSFYDEEFGFMCSNTLLFGLSTAVMFFTKINRPVVGFMRSLGVKVVNMIDDWFGSADAAAVRMAQWRVSQVLGALGWITNDNGTAPAKVTLFLGVLVDSELYEFRAPADKVDRCKALVLTLRQLAQRGRTVQVHDIQRLTGYTASLFIAIPVLRAWTRSLYRDQSLATQVGAIEMRLDKNSIEELDEIPRLLENHNGAPIRDVALPGDAVFVDAGETGFGAHTTDAVWYGAFPAALIGTSSTKRELEGLLAAFRMAEAQAYSFPSRLTLYMDSHCAVRNLVKGGGPVPELCDVVKAISKHCERMGLTIYPRWIPREKNTIADALSKKFDAEWKVTDRAVLHISLMTKVKPTLPRFNTIRDVIKGSVAANTPVALVVPRWAAQSWWRFLETNFDICPLPPEIFDENPGIGRIPWKMVLATRGSQTQARHYGNDETLLTTISVPNAVIVGASGVSG